MSRIARESLVVAGFLVFGVYATWPFVTHMFTSFSDLPDNYQHAWMLWWVKEQLLALQNPFYTDQILAPVGSYVAYGPLMPLVGALLAPITVLFGVGVARNAVSFAVPVIASYVTYRLGIRIGLDRSVAVVTGALYGFSSQLIMRAYHLNLMAGLIFVPLALLCAVRYYQRQTPRDALMLGASLGAAVLVDQQTALFAAALGMGYLAAVHLKDRVHPRKWIRALVLATVTGVVAASPQLLMTLEQDSVDTPTTLEHLAPAYKDYNSSLLAMVEPSPSLRVTPGPTEQIIGHSDPGEFPTAFGWGVLALAGTGLVLSRRRRLAIGLFAALIATALLALGPEVTFSSHPHIPLSITYGGQEMSGLMPFTWLAHIPSLDQVRAPSRFTLLGLLPATLLAGLGLQALVRRGPGGQSFAIALVAVAVLEAGAPISRDDRQVPLTRNELYAPVKADKSDSILVDVPLGFIDGIGGLGDNAPETMLRATEHGHPVAGGHLSRLPVNRIGELAAHRFYSDIIIQQSNHILQQPALSGEEPEDDEAENTFSAAVQLDPARGDALVDSGQPLTKLFPPPDPRAGRIDAIEMGVGWVVVWPEASAEARRYIRAVGFRLVRLSDGIGLYRLTHPELR